MLRTRRFFVMNSRWTRKSRGYFYEIRRPAATPARVYTKRAQRAISHRLICRHGAVQRSRVAVVFPDDFPISRWNRRARSNLHADYPTADTETVSDAARILSPSLLSSHHLPSPPPQPFRRDDLLFHARTRFDSGEHTSRRVGEKQRCLSSFFSFLFTDVTRMQPVRRVLDVRPATEGERTY